MEMEIDGALSRNELIERVYEYLDSEDIEMSSEKISLRDLRDILTNKFKGLTDAKKRLTNSRFLCVLFSLFNKNCLEGVSNIFKNEDVMGFRLELSDLFHVVGPLYRRYGEGEKFYYNSYSIDEITRLLRRNSGKIESVFDEIELLKDMPLSFDFSVNDDIFSGFIRYYDLNVPVASLYVNNSISNELATMEYVDSPSIKTMIMRHMEELLGKVPVEVAQLPISMQSLIGEELENRKATKLGRKFK